MSLLLRDFTTVIVWGIIARDTGNGEGGRRGRGKTPIFRKLYCGKKVIFRKFYRNSFDCTTLNAMTKIKKVEIKRYIYLDSV